MAMTPETAPPVGEEIHRDVLIWYDADRSQREREVAARGAISRIEPLLHLSHRVVAAIGEQAAEDVRQETYRKLMSPERKVLSTVPPAATIQYIRKLLLNRALDALRATSRRKQVEELPGDDQLSGLLDAAHQIDVEATLEREREMARLSDRVSTLEVEDRVGLLLTMCPDRIKPTDWKTLFGQRRPAIEPPENPLDDDHASLLLWPPSGPETRDARARRMDRFRKRRARALDVLLSHKDDAR